MAGGPQQQPLQLQMQAQEWGSCQLLMSASSRRQGHGVPHESSRRRPRLNPWQQLFLWAGTACSSSQQQAALS